MSTWGAHGMACAWPCLHSPSSFLAPMMRAVLPFKDPSVGIPNSTTGACLFVNMSRFDAPYHRTTPSSYQVSPRTYGVWSKV